MMTLILAQGTGDTWTIPVVDENGNPISYTGTEILSCRIWPGANFAALVTLYPIWLNAGAGTITLTIPGVSTATLDPATYWIEVRVTDAGGDHQVWAGRLTITPAVGTVAVPAVYCGYADMVAALSWIGDLQSEQDTAGFLLERGMARKWTDDCIQRHYRGGGGLSRDNYFLPWPQYIPGNPNRLASIYRSGAMDTTLQSWLDANGLLVSAQVVEANACYALGKVLERQIGEKSKADNPYDALARKYFARAENALSMLNAEIDSTAPTTGLGYQSTAIVIKMTNVDTLDG